MGWVVGGFSGDVGGGCRMSLGPSSTPTLRHVRAPLGAVIKCHSSFGFCVVRCRLPNFAAPTVFNPSATGSFAPAATTTTTNRIVCAFCMHHAARNENPYILLTTPPPEAHPFYHFTHPNPSCWISALVVATFACHI